MSKIILTLMLLASVVPTVHSQLKEGDNLIGGTIGLWPSNSSAALGFNYENQVLTAGITSLDAGGLLRYSNVSKNSSKSYSNVFIGGQVNLHPPAES